MTLHGVSLNFVSFVWNMMITLSFSGILLEEFSRNTGIFFIPYVYYKGADQGDVVSFVEKYMTSWMKNDIDERKSINGYLGTNDTSLSNVWAYSILLTDEGKLCKEHGIIMRFRIYENRSSADGRDGGGANGHVNGGVDERADDGRAGCGGVGTNGYRGDNAVDEPLPYMSSDDDDFTHQYNVNYLFESK